MNEKFVDAKNSTVIKEAKKIILEFVDDYFSDERKGKAKEVLESCEVYFADSYLYTNSSKSTNGKAEEGAIYIPSNFDEMIFDGSEDFESEQALCTVIHEFAHVFKRTNKWINNA